ncbi:hypothetical protein Plo01_79760 [Planobispora longispora]|uniref:Uncharacterized protein n=1 Tax=Planobispora longispora TaxID=28887 RepID=A0A8J3RTJ4_9ACTN|nr:hypothetical protein GCM10020093_023330 [Planobispora longispora]GIH81547.1 hypothetical protein Plo01_79760 [Planobispora longispora]
MTRSWPPLSVPIPVPVPVPLPLLLRTRTGPRLRSVPAPLPVPPRLSCGGRAVTRFPPPAPRNGHPADRSEEEERYALPGI